MDPKAGEVGSYLAEGAPKALTRHAAFLLLCGAGIVLSLSVVTRLLKFSLESELYTYIPGIPFISLYFFYVNRKTIFADLRWSWRSGLLLMASGIVLSFLAKSTSVLDENDYLSMATSGVVLWLFGAFLTAYGSQSFRKGLFPLLILVFVIPIPTPILDGLVELLRMGSTLAAYVLFKLTGVPVYREGFVFSIPGTTVNVAPECSGIRSSVALLITSLIGGHLFLRNGWSRVLLALTVFPITIFKNSLRIVSLTLLAAYVDPMFVRGHWLHRTGGLPFFAVGLCLMVPLLWGLMKWEKRKGRQRSS
jgi:exosortase